MSISNSSYVYTIIIVPFRKAGVLFSDDRILVVNERKFQVCIECKLSLLLEIF